MRRYLDFSRKNFVRFILLTAVLFLLFYMGYISLTLLIFFEFLFLLRFIHTKKFIEHKLLNNYSWYGGLPGWGKWAVLLVIYMVLFMIFKWFLINVIIEGIFHIPLDEELQEMARKAQEA